MQYAASAEPTIQITARSADLLIDWGGNKLHLDRAGRWLSFRRAGRLFRRALDGAVWAASCPVVRPRPSEADVVHEQVRQTAAQLIDELPNTPPERLLWTGGHSELARVLENLVRAAAWDVPRYAREAARYAEAYPEPVRILPPDRIRDLVVIPAQGCPHGRCEFCAFYRDATYKVLSERELERHLDLIAELFADSLALRTGLFLGGANALSLSQARLRRVISQTRMRFDERRRGMAAFWDPDHSPVRSMRDWSELIDDGFLAAYVGLETGSAEARAKLGKSSDIARFVKLVHEAKQAGVMLGVIVLAGIDAEANEHAEQTVLAIQRMGLEPTDIVFISPLEGAPAARTNEQMQLLARLLAVTTEARVAPYRMDTFRYYA